MQFVALSCPRKETVTNTNTAGVVLFADRDSYKHRHAWSQMRRRDAAGELVVFVVLSCPRKETVTNTNTAGVVLSADRDSYKHQHASSQRSWRGSASQIDQRRELNQIGAAPAARGSWWSSHTSWSSFHFRTSHTLWSSFHFRSSHTSWSFPRLWSSGMQAPEWLCFDG